MLFLRVVKRLLSVFCVGAVLSLFACNGKTPVKNEVMQDSVMVIEDLPEDTLLLFDDEPEPVTADMLFADFFYAFTTDSHYQQQRVAFPLRSQDGDAEPVSLAEWNERGVFRAQDFYAVIYDRESDMVIQSDTTLTTVAVDKVHLHEQKLDRYHFQRLQGKWLLTDYDTRMVSHTPQGSFLEFFGRFVTDTLFQRESILFPLLLVSEEEDGEEDGQAELTAEEWTDFREQMPLPADVMTTIDYGQAAISENRKVLLMEGLSNGLFVKYKFDRTDGRWQLYEIDF